MIVFSDLHLRDESEDTVFNEVLPSLAALALKERDFTLACLGDIYHLRYAVSVRLQNRLLNFLEEFTHNHGRALLLPGNHDQINVSGENALEALGKISGVQVFTEPTCNEFGLWIPYRKYDADVGAAFGIPGIENSPKVVWAHLAAKGALMNNHAVNKDGIDPDLFVDWRVFSGHYHKTQMVGGIFYVGSPYQTKADEAGQEKGYMLWDNETQESGWIQTRWGKCYHNLGVIDTNSGNRALPDIQPGDEVRGIAAPDMDAGDLNRLFSQTGANCIITPQVESSAQRLGMQSGATFYDYVQKYVDQLSGSLDKKKLMEIFDSLRAA